MSDKTPEGVYVFNYRISLISTMRLAGEENIKAILGVKQIPKAMRALLAQNVIPREVINPLEKYKKRVRDYLIKHATHDELLGWIIDPARREEIMAKVQEIQVDFFNAKNRLLAEYDTRREDHLDTLRESCRDIENIDCEAFIGAVRKAQPDPAYLDQQIQFVMLKPRFITLDPEEASQVSQGVYQTALKEIGKRAVQAADFKEVPAKIRALDEIEQKLTGLSYIDNRMQVIADGLLATGKTLPGYVSGKKDAPENISLSLALTGIFSIIADTQRITEAAEKGENPFPVNGLGLSLETASMGGEIDTTPPDEQETSPVVTPETETGLESNEDTSPTFDNWDEQSSLAAW